MTIAALPRSTDDERKIAFVEMSQKFFLNDLNKIFDCALQGCEKIQQILDQAIREHANETLVADLTDT